MSKMRDLYESVNLYAQVPYYGYDESIPDTIYLVTGYDATEEKHTNIGAYFSRVDAIARLNDCVRTSKSNIKFTIELVDLVR